MNTQLYGCPEGCDVEKDHAHDINDQVFLFPSYAETPCDEDEDEYCEVHDEFGCRFGRDDDS